jgi:glucose/arabinose dehydrogenase
LNRIERGRNYGWPVISYGMNYNGTPFTGRTRAEGMEQPVEHWTPSLAVCGIDFYEGDRFPRWRHHLFIASLRAEELWRYRLDGHRVADKELVLKGLGRIRDVHSGPDGHLYLVLNNPGRIVRLVNADP